MCSEKINENKSSIIEICSTNVKNFFENNLKNVLVPDFQRPFEWNDELIKQFLDDLVQADDNNPVVIGNFIFYQGEFSDEKNNLEQNDKCKLYFNNLREKLSEPPKQSETLNSEICEKYNIDEQSESKGDNKKLAIIDGQQRLTVLLALWSKLSQDKSENKIQQDFFESCPDTIKNFKGTVNFKNILFTYIVTNDLDQAFLMFDTQNTRGVKLSDFDLIKAYHLNDVYTQNEEKAKEYARFWETKSKENFDGKILSFYINKGYQNYQEAGILELTLILTFFIRKIINLDQPSIDYVLRQINFGINTMGDNHWIFEEFKDKKNITEVFDNLILANPTKNSFFDFLGSEINFLDCLFRTDLEFPKYLERNSIYRTDGYIKFIIASYYYLLKRCNLFNKQMINGFIISFQELIKDNSRPKFSSFRNILRDNLKFFFKICNKLEINNNLKKGRVKKTFDELIKNR